VSKPSRRSRPPAAVRKPGSTRRSQEAGRRTRARRRRWIGAGVTALVVGALVALIVVATTGRSTVPGANAGAQAPDGTFSTATGATRTISSLRGEPTLVWFVSTWCSSCQAGTQAMASQIQTFAQMHVRVVELELADDLGQPGPSITSFGRQLAGPAYTNADWTFGVATAALTTTYDPASDLDIYYLLDSNGRITYVNSSPGSTMGQLLSHAAQVT
jgi:thiol-disulfide isomerase/thioredoxin